MKKTVKKIAAAGLCISMIGTMTGCSLFRKTNSGKVNAFWYMKLTDDDENKYTIEGEGTTVAVALEDGYSDDFAIARGDEVFLNLDTVMEHIDERFYWDQNENLVMFTNASEIYESAVGSDSINGEPVDFMTSFTDGGNCYLNLKFVRKYIDFDYKYVKEQDSLPGRVSITSISREVRTMVLEDDEYMRTGGDYQNLIVTEIPEDSVVTIIQKSKNWDYVRTEDGLIGYLPVSELDGEKKEKHSYQSDAGEYTHITMDQKVSLVWNMVTNAAANANLSSQLQGTKGLNVISPTWFTLQDAKGNISSLADRQYVQTAHAAGLQVWAMANDTSEKGKKATPKVLQNSALRRKMVNDLIFYATEYDVDGINIDFEYVTEALVQDYLQFLRELSIQCRKNKLVLSIDNYVPTDANAYYDREQQGKLADYIIVMSYDEHATSEDGAGSVSSMTFTENAIKETVAQVKDAARVINGMPFYTTVWRETPEKKSDGSGTYVKDSVNGNYYLTSQDVTMDTANRLVKDAGASSVFNKETGQNFVSYEEGKDLILIWLEDKTSVASRFELMNQYSLGGAAYWCLTQESDDIWDVVGKYMSDGK